MESSTCETIWRRTLEWQGDRKRYPGWVIAPKQARDAIWDATRPHLEKVEQAAKDSSVLKRAVVLYELNWRLEVSLMPLFTSLAELTRETIKEITLDKMSDVSSLNELQHTPYQDPSELRRIWIDLALALLRYHREEREDHEFADLLAQIPTEKLSRDEEARVRFECAMHGLYRLDDDRVREEIARWPETTDDPLWSLRKASLLAEIGESDEAVEVAKGTLKSIRSMSLRSETMELASREAWAIVLLMHADFNVSRGDWTDQGRMEELDRMKCDPREEIKSLISASHERMPQQTQKERLSRDFHTGVIHSRTRINSGGFEPFRPAYEMVRCSEDVPCPPRLVDAESGVSRDAWSVPLETFSKWFAHKDPVRWVSIAVRLQDHNQLDDILSRFNVASLSSRELQSWREMGERPLIAVKLKKKHAGSSEMGFRIGLTRHAQCVAFGINILSRVCVRMPVDVLHEWWDLAIGLYRSIDDRKCNCIIKPLKSLFVGIMRTLPEYELERKLHSLITLPTPAHQDNWHLFAEVWHRIMDEFTFNCHAVQGGDGSYNWSGTIQSLFDEVNLAPTGSTAQAEPGRRDYALEKLRILYDYGLLATDHVKRLSSVFWQDCVEGGVPSWILYGPNAALLFPDPMEGMGVKRYRKCAFQDSLPLLKPGDFDPNQVLREWICATRTSNRQNRWASRRYVKWTVAERRQMLQLLEAWWDEEGRSLAGQRVESVMDAFLDSTGQFRERIRLILNVISYVILGADAENTELEARCRALVDAFRQSRLPVGAALPALRNTFPNSAGLERALLYELLRRETDGVDSALEGIFRYAEAFQSMVSKERTAAQGSVIRLVELVGEMASSVNCPILTSVVVAFRRMLELKWEGLPASVKELALRVLHDLFERASYERPPDEDVIAYDDVPKLREEAVAIARQLQKVGVKDDRIQKWLEIAKDDPLPEVRKLIDD